jgi:hypothetical protein
VGGTYEVGEEACVGGGGQQCVAEVTCVVWRRVVPLSGGHFGARRFSTGSWRTHVALLSSMRQLGCWKLQCTRLDRGGRDRIGER